MKIDKVKFWLCVCDGYTAKQLSIEFGVSRQAIDSMGKSTGLRDQIKDNKPKPKALMSAVYGIPADEARKLRRCGATLAYQQQRRNAHHRGIEWDLTLSQWWSVWESSGRWEQRGRELGGWVMGRYGDVGPYSPTNVVICNHSENAQVRELVRRSCKIHENEYVHSSHDGVISSSLSAPVA